MEARYEADLDNADEIVRSGARGRIAAHPHAAHSPGQPASSARAMRAGSGPSRRGSGGQLLREVGSLGSAVGAAVTGKRPLESFEFRPLMTFGALLLAVAAVGFWKPQVVFWPIGVVLAALGLQLVARGLQARLTHRRRARG